MFILLITFSKWKISKEKNGGICHYCHLNWRILNFVYSAMELYLMSFESMEFIIFAQHIF